MGDAVAVNILDGVLQSLVAPLRESASNLNTLWFSETIIFVLSPIATGTEVVGSGTSVPATDLSRFGFQRLLMVPALLCLTFA